jgi:hypothetical protein
LAASMATTSATTTKKASPSDPHFSCPLKRSSPLTPATCRSLPTGYDSVGLISEMTGHCESEEQALDG